MKREFFVDVLLSLSSLVSWQDDDRVLGLIPYYGEGMGKGQAQSSLNTRKAYLEATYWSVRALTSRVVVAVCTDADALFVESLVDEVKTSSPLTSHLEYLCGLSSGNHTS